VRVSLEFANFLIPRVKSQRLGNSVR